MRFHRLASAALLTTALLPAHAFGSTLLLNGVPLLTADMGAPLTIAIGGTPGDLTILFYDILPGPTTVFGHPVALGFSPFFGMLTLGTMPPSGAILLPTVVPTLPDVEQFTLYLVAAVGDPAQPPQFDFSNGASLTMQEPPDAGQPCAVMAGHKATFPSQGVGDKQGEPKPGVTVNWTLTQRPLGSSAVLSHATKPWPTIVPDLPGDYVAQAIITKYGKIYVDQAVIHASKLSFTGLPNGSILPGDTTLSGVLEAPSLPELDIDGQKYPVNNGGFGGVPLQFGQGESKKPAHAGVQFPDGSRLKTIQAFIKGVGKPLTDPAANSQIAQLTASGIARISDLVEDAAEQQNDQVEAGIKALPPSTLINEPGPLGGTLFSAIADVTAVEFNPAIGLTQSPKTTGIDTTIVLNNLKVTVKITGKISNVAYSVTGTATSNPATFKGVIALSPNVSTLTAAATSTTMTLSNFGLSLPGFPGSGSLLSQISSALSPYLANAMKTQMSTVAKNAMKTVYEGLADEYSVTTSGIHKVDHSATFAKVKHAAATLGFEMNSEAKEPAGKAPEAPQVPAFLSSPTTPPTIPTSGPGGAYDFVTGVSDDFLNLALAHQTLAGMLEKTDVAIGLTVGELKGYLTNVDLSGLDDDIPVLMDMHAGIAPFAKATPGGPGKVRFHFANVEIALNADLGSYRLPLVRLGLDGSFDANLGTKSDGTLAVATVLSGANAEVLESAFQDVISTVGSTVSDDLIPLLVDQIRGVITNTLESLRPSNVFAAVLSSFQSAAETLGEAAEWLMSYVSLP